MHLIVTRSSGSPATGAEALSADAAGLHVLVVGDIAVVGLLSIVSDDLSLDDLLLHSDFFVHGNSFGHEVNVLDLVQYGYNFRRVLSVEVIVPPDVRDCSYGAFDGRHGGDANVIVAGCADHLISLRCNSLEYEVGLGDLKRIEDCIDPGLYFINGAGLGHHYSVSGASPTTASSKGVEGTS